MKILPKSPSDSWLKNFIHPLLFKEKSYQLEASEQRTKIDQNESPFDWPDDLKNKVLQDLKKLSWNRYPEAYSSELRKLVANYSGVDERSIFLCAGSNYHITIIINLLCRNLKGKLIIAKPTFPLYEQHCRYENIPYEIWPLNSKLEYDMSLLPKLQGGSVVVLASPNNPTGSTLKKNDLENLLKDHPDVYFIVDEAYYEFNKDPYTDLLTDYPNLIILRTFSKAFAGAGVRLGYTLANIEFINELNKLTLPFVINHFAIVAMTRALSMNIHLKNIQSQVKLIVSERERVYKKLFRKIFIPKSQANFLYLTSETKDSAKDLDLKLKEFGIQGRLILSDDFLSGVRVSIETPKINQILLGALEA